MKYFSQRVEASRDALAARQTRGHDIEGYRPRLEAQDALLGLLKGFVEDTPPKQQGAVRRFDRPWRGNRRRQRC